MKTSLGRSPDVYHDDVPFCDIKSLDERRQTAVLSFVTMNIELNRPAYKWFIYLNK